MVAVSTNLCAEVPPYSGTAWLGYQIREILQGSRCSHPVKSSVFGMSIVRLQLSSSSSTSILIWDHLNLTLTLIKGLDPAALR